MRLVMLSDTHEQHEKLEVPDGDVLIHAGDWTIAGSIWKLKKAAEWFNDQPHKYKVAIAGNHDWSLQHLMTEGREDLAHDLFKPAIYLRDSSVLIDGVNFYGSPWTPRFMDWAFNADRGAAIRQHWYKIDQQKVDVLVTHGPPSYILDLVGQEHVGCEELMKVVDRNVPKVHVFGHIHCGYGHRNFKGTDYFNVAVCDMTYAVKNKPVVFDLNL